MAGIAGLAGIAVIGGIASKQVGLTSREGEVARRCGVLAGSGRLLHRSVPLLLLPAIALLLAMMAQ